MTMTTAKMEEPHQTGFCKTLCSFKRMSLTGTKGTCVLSVQKNFKVINQLGYQLIRVGGERNVHGSVSAKRNRKKWLVMTVSNIKPVMAKFN